MPNEQHFDLPSFEQDVFENLDILCNRVELSIDLSLVVEDMPAKGTLSIDSHDTVTDWWSRFKVRTNKATRKESYTPEDVAKRLSIVAKQAEEIVENRSIKSYLCPALQCVSDDAFEIAKIIIPILVSLSLAKTITVPLDSLLFALIPLSIARMGIASLCDKNVEK